MPFYEEGRKEGDFDLGIQTALERLLVSPQFLFRIERDPPGSPPGSAYRRQRSGTGLAPVVLPVEQHSRR